MLRQFHTHSQVLVRWRMIDDKLELARKLVRETCQNIAHRSRKDIDAAYMKHIIAATQDTETKARPPTGARSSSQDTQYIAGTIAYQGLRLLEEMGVH